MASATVAGSVSATYSVFIMPPAVSSSNSISSLTSLLGSCSISSRISCAVSSFEPRQDVGGLVGSHLFHDIGGLFGFERFENAGLNVGIDLGKRVGRHFAVDILENGLAVLRGRDLRRYRPRSAGCISSSKRLDMFRRRRRCGSGSRMLQNSQRMECGGMPVCSLRTHRGGTTPCTRRRNTLRMPMSTSSTHST